MPASNQSGRGYSYSDAPLTTYSKTMYPTQNPMQSWAEQQYALNQAQYDQTLSYNALQGAGGRGGGGSGGGGGGGASQQYDWQLRGLVNDTVRLGADMDLQKARDSNTGAQYGISQSRYGDQTAQNAAQRGFVGDQYVLGNDTANQRYNSALAAAGLTFDKTNRQVLSDNTARGSTLTAGFRDSNLETGRTRDLTTADATETRDLSLRGNLLSRDRSFSDLAFSDKANERTWLSDQENKKLADEQAKREATFLDRLANDYGIRREQIDQALKAGMAASGYSSSADQSKLMQALAADNQQANIDLMAANSAVAYQLLQAGINAPIKSGSSGKASQTPVGLPGAVRGSGSGAGSNRQPVVTGGGASGSTRPVMIGSSNVS